MNYTILVTGAAYGTQNASTAFLFCQSLVKTKHKLYSVFFYCDGVLNANRMTTPATDEFNLVEAWQKLNKKYKVKLYVCNSAALRRGVLEDEKKSNLNSKKGNLSLFFQLSGLLELAHSIKICDRIIQF
ncbi:MAG: sulfurtransferase complex subunit TusD [Buchnera aphidicola (Brevicoryne brassicae)]|uniref:Sulfurtransferase TusD n=1 Tax=Buchnera aphidicola (Brevicoryne brassicae) TaxID=911343 RepID=A0AAJ5PVH8_9GAMM|nr:sulfurtransferase complex subunit TusD [Buchnera aphidicola]QCI20075.1 sulfurtransferase complex subunit TusD [Buchnera aphidicola (Brevicoryne brassicae)]WAI18898.1 MAG: sulfurtransferase complex subunit TusD [Buchnera aphidicola (Brevicoryne brassicae)]